MCRSITDDPNLPSSPFRRPNRDLKIKSFHLRLTGAGARRLPEALTLVYAASGVGTPLEMNDAKIKPGAPAFAALHRTRTVEPVGGGEAAFASSDRVRVSDGVRFEVYVGAERVLKGVVRRMGVELGWVSEVAGVSAADVSVAGESGAAMTAAAAARRRKGRGGFCLKLEQIPEEGEEGCDCSGCEGWEKVGSDGGDDGGMDGWDGVVETEGVRWAVDVGIWVVCLGVGILVSQGASWRRRRKLI